MKIDGPRQLRSQFAQLVDRELVVAFFGVAELRAVPLHFGQLRFELQNFLGRLGSVALVAQTKQRLDVPLQRRARVGVLRVEVVIAIRQRRAALDNSGQIPRRVAVVLIDEESDGTADTDDLEAPEMLENLLLVGDAVDPGKLIGQRLEF